MNSAKNLFLSFLCINDRVKKIYKQQWCSNAFGHLEQKEILCAPYFPPPPQKKFSTETKKIVLLDSTENK